MNVLNKKNILLTSTSPVKLQAFKNIFDCKPKDSISVDGCGNPEQPVGHLETLICCKRRIEHALSTINVREYDGVISIENGIHKIGKECFDVVHIIYYDTNEHMYYHKSGCDFPFENYLWEETQNKIDNVKTTLGWSITIGDVVAEKFGYNKKNWIKEYVALGKPLDRVEQITNVMWELVRNKGNIVQANIRYIVDHLKDGIIFQDLSRIWGNPIMNKQFFNLLIWSVEKHFLVNDTKIDTVVGLESRGFGIGYALANAINAGFVMVRKPKKLVGETWSETYDKEYGTDTLELLKDSIKKGSNVLIVDDVIATGGSMGAAVKLVKNVKDVNILGCLACTKVESLFEEAEQKITTSKIITMF